MKTFKLIALLGVSLLFAACSVINKDTPLVGGYVGAASSASAKALEPIGCLSRGSYTGVLLRPAIVDRFGVEQEPAEVEYPLEVRQAIEKLRDYRCPNRLPEGQFFDE